MFTAFQRPKGAQADLKELEYVSSLHQSQLSKIRVNGTISAGDIQLFIKSRYAIDVNEEESLDILRGLGGISDVRSLNAAAAASGVNDDNSGNDCGATGAVDEKFERDQNDNSHRPSTNSQQKVPSPIISSATSNDSFDDNQNQNQQHSSKQKEESEQEDEFLDLVQLTAIIFIPTILKACHDVVSLNKQKIDIQHEMEESVKYATEQIESINYKTTPVEMIKDPMMHYELFEKRRYWKRKVKDIRHAQDHQVKPRWIVKDVLRILLASVQNEHEVQQRSDWYSNSFYNEQRQKEDGNDRSPSLCSPSYKLTLESLQILLQAHNENEMSQNIPLLKSMISACSPSSNNSTKDESIHDTEVILNEVSFAQALSFDLHLWNIGCEDDLTTTTYHDVFHKDHLDDFDENVFNFPHYSNAKNNVGEKIRYGLDGIRKRENEGGEMRNISNVEAGSTRARSRTVDEIDVEAPSDRNEKDNDVEKDEDTFFDAIPNSTQDEALSEALTSLPPLESFVSCKDVTIAEKKENNHDENDGKSVIKIPTKEPRHVKAAPYIDYVVDTYRSLLFLMSLWVFYIFTVVLFMNIVGRLEYNSWSCDSKFACDLARDLLAWVTFAGILSLGGLIVIVPISFANDPTKKSPYVVAFSFTLLVIYTVCPYMILTGYRRRIAQSNDGETLSAVEALLQSDAASLAITLFLSYGCILMLKIVLLFINTIVPYESIIKKKMHWYMLPSHFTSTANVKLAGTHKVNEFLKNAIELHHIPRLEERNNKNDFFRYQNAYAMNNFMFEGEHHEQCGGFIWTWRRILKRDLARKDGIWLHCRLAIGQEGQVITLAFYVILLFWGADKLAKATQDSRDRVMDDEGLSSEWRDWALNMIPEPWMIYASFIPGGFIALLSGIMLILIYVPSTVTTVLKLRSGIIPTLSNENFNSYRSSADSIFYNIGNMVYAMIGSVGFMFVIFAGIIFLFVWPATKGFMMVLLPWGLGLCITILIKTALLMFCRANFQSAFFRRHPWRANFSALAMECWNIGVGGGVMIGRLTQFLLASAFWIGRIDVSFLDENVNLFGYGFDEIPTGYRKEILVHEAHRHPFMERLGVMYMMLIVAIFPPIFIHFTRVKRLKHGKNFSCDAGACWRILFVKSLMPWLEKYRRVHANEDNISDPLFSFAHSIRPYSARLKSKRQ